MEKIGLTLIGSQFQYTIDADSKEEAMQLIKKLNQPLMDKFDTDIKFTPKKVSEIKKSDKIEVI